MKRKRSYDSLSMKKKKRSYSYSYLPDDCWESIIQFIVNDDHGCRCLKSLSLVSKHFLSLTNSHIFSFTIYPSRVPFLKRLFKRFTNLTSLRLNHGIDFDNVFHLISCFLLKKLTSLIVSSGYNTFPVNGLRDFSQNITTLTSLTCSSDFLFETDLSLIADCFPLLKELNLIQPNFINGIDSLLSKRQSDNNQTDFINGIHSLLSKSQCIQHLNLERTFFLNDTHVAEFSLFLGNLVSINLTGCDMLTESALFSLVRNCPSLGEIKMESTEIGKESVVNSGVYPQLKYLYLGRNSLLRDEMIIMLASFFPNLQLLDLNTCEYVSEGIFQVLRRCGMIKHLNLARCPRVKRLRIKTVIPQLEVLNLSYTKVDDKTLYSISKNCCGLLKLLLKKCKRVTKKGVKHVVENKSGYSAFA